MITTITARKIIYATLGLLLSLSAWISTANAADPFPLPKQPPKKLAFLVGVSEYDKAGLRNLKYAESDVSDLAAELRKASFEITVLTGSAKGDERATRENLRKQLQEKFVEKTKKLNKNDIVLIGFSGHGLQFNVNKGGVIVEDAFYCPVDALKSDTSTLLSVSELMDSVALNSGAENNLFVIDACRDNPGKGSKGIDGSRISLPGNMACLFGASSGTQSYESDKLKHGLLTHCLLQGLQGKAKDADGDVNWDSLVGYTKKQVTQNAREWAGEDQTPNSISNIRGAPPVLASIEIRSIGVGGKSVAKPAMLIAPFNENAARAQQAKWATYLNRTGPLLKNGIGMEMQLVPPGEFTMGGETVEKLVADFPKLKEYLSPKVDTDGSNLEEFTCELPLHKVQISQPFYMGKFHVTKKQFREFVAATGYKTEPEQDGVGGRGYDPAGKNGVLPYDPKFNWATTGFKYDDDHPVVNVTWNDAEKFCNWLSKKEGRTYRLPTEAEWEYACRAGTTTRYHNGNDPEKLVEIGNVTDVSVRKVLPKLDAVKANDAYTFTSPVGLFKPNNFGLHEMQGNVPTFCADWYSKNYYDNSQLRDPQGPNGGELRIFRGGGWLCVPYQCRTGYRHAIKPSKCCCCIGFRIACDVKSDGE